MNRGGQSGGFGDHLFHMLPIRVPSDPNTNQS